MVDRPVRRANPKFVKRRSRGYTMAEFGPTLLLAFVVLVFPLWAFGTIGVRYVFLINAARLAAQQASRAQTFLSNNPNPGAVSIASTVSQKSLNSIGGNTVQWISTDTYVYQCPLGSTTVTTPGANKPLTTQADQSNNSYNCVVKIHATIQPIWPGFPSMVGNVPGLNQSLDAWAQGTNYFENTSNLNI
jgi:hypothetical protein